MPAAGTRSSPPSPFDLDAFARPRRAAAVRRSRASLVGHYDGTPPQAEALALTDPARGRAPAGRDTALVVYSGISVKMLVDRVFGAELLTMFTVDYEPGGSAQVHDHPFEETYFFLDGEIERGAGRRRSTRFAPATSSSPASAARTASSTPATAGSAGSRPRRRSRPTRHSYRWLDHWKRFEEGVD